MVSSAFREKFVRGFWEARQTKWLEWFHQLSGKSVFGDSGRPGRHNRCNSFISFQGKVCLGILEARQHNSSNGFISFQGKSVQIIGGQAGQMVAMVSTAFRGKCVLRFWKIRQAKWLQWFHQLSGKGVFRDLGGQAGKMVAMVSSVLRERCFQIMGGQAGKMVAMVSPAFKESLFRQNGCNGF